MQAVQVTEWEEPQAVIGSYLHRYAYPGLVRRPREARPAAAGGARSHGRRAVGLRQLRGEYLFFAEGAGGMRVYDVATIANKGVSQRIITAPFSPLGHDTHVGLEERDLRGAAHQPADRARAQRGRPDAQVNQEQPFHPIYNYAVITDAEEGLIVVDVNTLADGEPRNNFLKRAATWNEGGILAGARHVTLGGHYAYITADGRTGGRGSRRPAEAPQGRR